MASPVAGAGDGDGQCGHVPLVRFADGQDFIERLTGLGRRADEFVEWDAANQSAALLGLGARAAGDVFVRQELLDVQPLLLGHPHRQVGREDVAGMVQHNEQDARPAFGG